jgi:predicted  nucleic acid-binding Zn-ribbon protein
MKEIESNISSVESAIKAERSEVESREDGLISESSEKFLQKLEPFLIMATKEIQNIKTSFEHVEERVCSLCSFFAEDKSTKVSESFLYCMSVAKLLCTFFSH